MFLDVLCLLLHMVGKGNAQIKGIDFEDTFGPVARLEAIRIFLALVFHKNIKGYQIDLKYAFLNGDLEE